MRFFTFLSLAIMMILGGTGSASATSEQTQAALAKCRVFSRMTKQQLAIVARNNNTTPAWLKQKCYELEHSSELVQNPAYVKKICAGFLRRSPAQLAALALQNNTTVAKIRSACAIASKPAPRPRAPSREDNGGFRSPFQCLNDASCPLFQACIQTGLGSQCMSTNGCTVPGKACSIQSDCCSRNCNANGTCN